jgi:hypothetical protein
MQWALRGTGRVTILAAALGLASSPRYASALTAGFSGPSATAGDVESQRTPLRYSSEACCQNKLPAAIAEDTRGLELPELSHLGNRSGVAKAGFRSKLPGIKRYVGTVTGFRHGLWLQGEDRLTKGVAVQLSPLVRNSRLLRIESVLIDRQEEASASRTTVKRNDVWSVAADSRLLGSRLWLHGEYGLSQQLHGGEGLLLAPTDRAYNLQARYSGRSTTLAQYPFSWSLSLGRDLVSDSFWSLADGGLVRGELVDRAATRLGWGRLNATFRYDSAINNIDDDPDVVTSRTKTLAWELDYAAQSLNWLPMFGTLLGTPSYTLSLKRKYMARAQPLETLRDRYTEIAGLIAQFSPGPWCWELDHTVSQSYIEGETAPVSDNERTRLHFALQFSERLKLTPEIRWQVLEEYRNNVETRTIAGALKGAATLIPDRIDARVRLEASRLYDANRTQGKRTLGLSGSFAWRPHAPRTEALEVIISLKGKYRYTADTAGLKDKTVQRDAYAGIQITWPKLD